MKRENVAQRPLQRAYGVLRYKSTTCKMCGNEFQQIETRNRDTCRDCRPYKRGVRA